MSDVEERCKLEKEVLFKKFEAVKNEMHKNLTELANNKENAIDSLKRDKQSLMFEISSANEQVGRSERAKVLNLVRRAIL